MTCHESPTLAPELSRDETVCNGPDCTTSTMVYGGNGNSPVLSSEKTSDLFKFHMSHMTPLVHFFVGDTSKVADDGYGGERETSLTSNTCFDSAKSLAVVDHGHRT